MTEKTLTRFVAGMIDLGRLALAFGWVERATAHPDGVTPESDTDHTVMLGLIACALAREHYPHLDRGLIAQYVLVHDLREVHAGDTHTLRTLSADAKREKHLREEHGGRLIRKEFQDVFPWVPDMNDEYEALLTPEARFVKALDKLMPKITQVLNGAVTVRAAGMGAAELSRRHAQQVQEMQAYAGDFPELMEMMGQLIDMILPMLPERAPDPVPEEAR
jgi:putative hydrolase of HD superfamily